MDVSAENLRILKIHSRNEREREGERNFDFLKLFPLMDIRYSLRLKNKSKKIVHSVKKKEKNIQNKMCLFSEKSVQERAKEKKKRIILNFSAKNILAHISRL